MGNFFVVLPALDQPDQAAAVFQAGIDRANSLLPLHPNSQLRADWFNAATFQRLNSTGSPIVTDPATGTWLATLGVWFHKDGFATGEEPRLLDRYPKTAPAI